MGLVMKDEKQLHNPWYVEFIRTNYHRLWWNIPYFVLTNILHFEKRKVAKQIRQFKRVFLG